MQFMQDKLTDFFFVFCNNTYTPFQILSKDKMIQYNTIKIGSKHT